MDPSKQLQMIKTAIALKTESLEEWKSPANETSGTRTPEF